tara:strand:- start:190 stop:432 length:243 start_codon:yes stop_codon:yes gene_type:complete
MNPVEHGTLLADGFESALIGTAQQYNRTFAVYDYTKCVDILINRDGFTHDEALEHMEVNVLGAWVGESTPAFIIPFNGVH